MAILEINRENNIRS